MRTHLSQITKNLLGPSIPILSINGVINAEMTDKVTDELKKISTFRAVALAVAINSPGGLPVQSHIIAQKLLKFTQQKQIKLYTFARDVTTSGGYFILCVGDRVFVDPVSIVGSIGVIMTKFRLQPLLQRCMVQGKFISSNQKLLTSMMNPFHELAPEDKTYLEQNCASAHNKFIAHVQNYRKDKLKNIDGKIFSGQVYLGQEAVKNGLADEMGSMGEILEKLHPKATFCIPDKTTKIEKMMKWV